MRREEIINIIATELQCSEMMQQYDDFTRTVKGGVWASRIYALISPHIENDNIRNQFAAHALQGLLASNEMKRYAVFTMEAYYPAGGWDDMAGLFDSRDEAFEFAKSARCDWYEVVDLVEGNKILEEISEGKENE